MKKFWESKILGAFLFWRILLFAVAFVAVLILPFKNSFPYWNLELVPTHFPAWVWGFGNFDGVHYLRMVKTGYSSEYTQAFFPLYPLVVRVISFISTPFVSGLLVSNLSFLLALFALFKLWRLDYSEKVSFRSVALLAAFPTAFYFGAIYSEALFLLLAVLCLYCARVKNFWLAGLLAALASATRVTGIFLWAVILTEIYQLMREEKYSLKTIDGLSFVFALSAAPAGLLAYMIYLKTNFGNALYFLSAQSDFGAGRSSTLVFLPQVLIRYVKIFLTVPFNSYPFFNAALEFIFTVLPLAGVLVFFKSIRPSYLVFILGCLILPTLTGTLSSMPRYALMFFPALPILAQTKDRPFKIILISFIMAQIVLLSLFVRGYWVA